MPIAQHAVTALLKHRAQDLKASPVPRAPIQLLVVGRWLGAGGWLAGEPQGPKDLRGPTQVN